MNYVLQDVVLKETLYVTLSIPDNTTPAHTPRKAQRAILCHSRQDPTPFPMQFALACRAVLV